MLLPYPGVHPPSQGAAAPHHAAVRLPSEAEVQLHAAAAPFPGTVLLPIGAVLLPIGAVLLPTGAALPPPEVLLHQEAIPADTVRLHLPAAAVPPAAIPAAAHPAVIPEAAVHHPAVTPVVAVPHLVALPAAAVHLHTGSL